jgi:cation diffusion facilitator family transporter
MKTDNKLDKVQGIIYSRIILSFLLTIFKLLTGIFGNSTLLLADAVRSLSEFLNEAMESLGLYIGKKPEDRSHNYGHGKILTLCMEAVACVLLFAAFHTFSLGLEQLLMFIQGKEYKTPNTIALFASILAFVLRDIIFVDNYESRTREIFPKDGTPIKELFVSGFIILCIGCTFLPGKNLDIADFLAAVLVSFNILWASGRLLYRAGNELIEASLDDDTNRRIREIMDKTQGVIGSGELKTRKIGNGIAINACITVHSILSIQETEEIANSVEERLKAAFGEEIYTLIKIEPIL